MATGNTHSDSKPPSANQEALLVRYDEEPSKIDKLLGNGRVADILLWRDEKKTFSCFLLLVLFYHSFFLAGETVISSVSKLLLLFLVLLCSYHILPPSVYGFRIDRLSSSSFEVSEADIRNCLVSVTSVWNELVHLTNTMAEEEDWFALFMVLVVLYLLKLIVLKSLSMVIGLALILSFTSCFVYEQYEEEIDSIATVIRNNANNGASLLITNLPTPLSKAFSVLKPLAKKDSNHSTS